METMLALAADDDVDEEAILRLPLDPPLELQPLLLSAQMAAAGVATLLDSTGLTRKPISFLTMAGVMTKLEKWLVSIDILGALLPSTFDLLPSHAQ